MFMWGRHSTGKKSCLLLVSLAALLTFVLTACGGTGSGTGPTPTPIPTGVQGFGAAHGCPSDTVVSSVPPAANVTIMMSDANALVTTRVGDVVEIQLPFGLRWTGPMITGSGLHLNAPAGYASTVLGMCIWRFNAVSGGTAHLTFFARAICQKNQYCPQYVLTLPFTIVVK